MTDEPADDAPVTLAEACRLFFGGRLTKSSLRTEARKGNLELIRIANKDFVTHNGIKRMIEKCTRPSSASNNNTATTKEVADRSRSPIAAQEALRMKLAARKLEQLKR